MFHWTVRLVIRTLFNCADEPGRQPDNIASSELPGIFGHVQAYFGVVEPQMRKALHVHMLVQLLGFSHPDDLFSGGLVEATFRRLWYFVASISFRSTEAFAHYLHVPEAMRALQSMPLLHFTKSQRAMIGEERVQQSERAQMTARGLTGYVGVPATVPEMPFFTSSACADADITATEWSAKATLEVFARTKD